MLNHEFGANTSKLEDDCFIAEHGRKLRQELAKGQTYDQACEKLNGLEQAIKNRVAENFLRIYVSELHLGKGYEVDDIALILGIPLERVESTLHEMLRSIGRELAGQMQQFSSLTH